MEERKEILRVEEKQAPLTFLWVKKYIKKSHFPGRGGF